MISKKDRSRSRTYEPKSFVTTYLGLLITAVGAALGIYFILITWIPGADKDNLDTMKTALAIVAGSGAGAALYVNYRRQRNDESDSLREHDRLFTDRYTKAAEQLGNDSAAVRLAGMYALARIADDSERDRDTCMNVLCAYLRMPYDPVAKDADQTERNVRLTAQRILEARLRPEHNGFWNNADIDLSGASLIEAAFSGARMNRAYFKQANFYGNSLFGQVEFAWRTWFTGARFHSDVWFGYSKFLDQTSFDETRFDGEAKFRNAFFGYPTIMFNKTLFCNVADFTNATIMFEIPFTDASFSKTHSPQWPDGVKFEDDKVVPDLDQTDQASVRTVE